MFNLFTIKNSLQPKTKLHEDKHLVSQINHLNKFSRVLRQNEEQRLPNITLNPAHLMIIQNSKKK